MLIYHGRSTVSWKMMCLFTSIKAYCLLFYNNIWSSMNSMALLLLCMGEANAQTRIACSMAGREDGFVLESFGFPLPISNCKYAKTADGNPRKALPRMAVRYHAACILLLAILHVVLKQANAGQEVVQELMKQRQKSHENKPPSTTHQKTVGLIPILLWILSWIPRRLRGVRSYPCLRLYLMPKKW